MNQQQFKHFKSRLDSIYNEKCHSIPNKYGLTTDQKDKLFKENKVFVEKSTNGSYTIVWEGEQELKDKATKRTKMLRQKYDEVLDNALFGDNEQAIKLLEDFRNL